MKNQPRSSFVMFVKASDAVSCPLLSLVFADRSLLGADYDDANCISQIVKKHFLDLARCISQIVKKHFLDLARCIPQIMPSLASLVSGDHSLLGDHLLLQLQTKVYDQPNNLWPERNCQP